MQKVLVVEDSPTQMNAVVASLKSQGYTIVTAESGEAALEVAAREQPNVVVLDVVLPQKNGFQVCRQLKQSPGTKAIKVILLTGRNQESDRFWGMKQGADMYMTKPFVESELVANVRSLF